MATTMETMAWPSRLASWPSWSQQPWSDGVAVNQGVVYGHSQQNKLLG